MEENRDASVPAGLKPGGKAELVWSSPHESINSLLGRKKEGGGCGERQELWPC